MRLDEMNRSQLLTVKWQLERALTQYKQPAKIEELTLQLWEVRQLLSEV